MPQPVKKITPYTDGKARKLIMKDLTKISILPNGVGANPEAHVSFYKSKVKPNESESDMPSKLTKAADGTTSEAVEKYRGDVSDLASSIQEGHQHGIRVVVEDGLVGLYCSYATGPDDEFSHYHRFTPNGDGSYSFLMDSGHTHDDIDVDTLLATVTSAVTKESDPASIDILEKFKDKLTQTRDGSVTKEQAMADETKKTAEDLLKESEARMARLEAIAKLSGTQKTHFDALDESAQDAFLAKSADERDMLVKAAAVDADSDDPVVYKMADGNVLRKSDGPVMVALAKQNDALTKTNIALVEKNEDQSLEKRVTELFPNLPGDMDVQKSLLKAVDSISDETARNGALEILKAKNTANAEMFKTVGSDEGVVKVEDQKGAEEKLDTLAKEYAGKHAVDYYTAYAAVSKTNRDLVKQAQAHTQA